MLMRLVLTTVLVTLVTLTRCEEQNWAKLNDFDEKLKSSPLHELSKQLRQVNLVENFVDELIRRENASLESIGHVLAAVTSNGVDGLVDVTNEALGNKILLLNNNSLHISCSGLEKLLISQAKVWSKTVFPKDILRQVVLFNTLRTQIKKASSEFGDVLEAQNIPVDGLTQVLASTGLPQRSKRAISDVFNNVLNALRKILITAIQNYLYNVLYPYQQVANLTLTVISNTALSLYTDELPSITFLANLTTAVNNAVVKIAEVVLSVRELINTVFETLTGTSSSSSSSSSSTTSSSRRRRDLGIFKDQILSRSKRATNIFTVIGNLLGVVWKFISKPVNVLLKLVVNNVFSTTLYQNVGKLILTPVKNLLIVLINFVFPCSSCS